MKAMVTGKATGEQRRWNFGDSRERFLTLDEFLEQKEPTARILHWKRALVEGYQQTHLADVLPGLH